MLILPLHPELFSPHAKLVAGSSSSSREELVPLPISSTLELLGGRITFPLSAEQNGRREKLRAHWYVLLGLGNKAKQKSEPKPLSFHPCLAMKVPSYFQARWQYFRTVYHTPSPPEQQTLSVLRDNRSLDSTSQRFCIKHLDRKKIFETCEPLSLSDKDGFWLIFLWWFPHFLQEKQQPPLP